MNFTFHSTHLNDYLSVEKKIIDLYLYYFLRNKYLANIIFRLISKIIFKFDSIISRNKIKYLFLQIKYL